MDFKLILTPPNYEGINDILCNNDCSNTLYFHNIDKYQDAFHGSNLKLYILTKQYHVII